MPNSKCDSDNEFDLQIISSFINYCKITFGNVYLSVLLYDAKVE